MTAAAGREIELKLLAAAADLDRLARWATARWRLLAPVETSRVVTDYHDTPDLALAATGVAVRLRQDGERRLLTIKTQGGAHGAESGAAATRREWELAVGDGPLDPADIDRAGAGELVPAPVRDRLSPLFRTAVNRTRLLLAPYDGAVVEMALDDGEAQTADGAAAPISEIELELRQGPLRALFDVALDLTDRAALRVAADSKADVGLRLLTGRRPQAVAAPPLGLSRLSTGEEALRHRARAAMRHLTANLPAAEAGDGAALIKMRVALARLRPALFPLDSAPAGDEAEKLADGRRWLADRLAPCPAWDELAALLANGGAERRLRRAVDDLRADAAQAALRTLRSPRLTSFILTAARRAEERPSAAPTSATALSALLDGPAAELAAVSLDRLAARTVKRLRRFAEGDGDAAPSLARRLRRLRREAETCRGLFAASAVDAWSATLNDLNAALERRAAAVGARRLLRVVAHEHRDAHDAALAWARFAAAERAQALDQARACARALNWPAPFWRGPAS